jgi:exonuclease VII small subunit
MPVVLMFSSAQLKIAHSSLDEVATYAQKRLDSARASFKTGLQDAKELQKELSELEKRVRTLKDKVRERWPVEYYTVRDETDG